MRALTLYEVMGAVGGNILNSKHDNILIKNISTDSRNISVGDLFIPIKGDNFDGHLFIKQAFEKGAICVLSEIDFYADNENYVIKVENTRKALLDLAEYYRSLFKIPVVGITGSVGKTTTKDIVASVLSKKYNVLKTEGNFNNEIGLPFTVFKLEDCHEILVVEMGMSAFGEIHNLAKVVRPDIAVITNIGVSHIENLGSRDGILKAKSEILDFMDKNAIVILNSDDDKLITLDEDSKIGIKWYGTENKKDLYADNIKSEGLEGISSDIHTNVGNFHVYIAVPGNHMVLNALAATAVGLEFDVSIDDIKNGIECFTPTKMRMSLIKNGKMNIINDVYNANPVSMKAAIDVLSGAEGMTAAILGDMLELGEFSNHMHNDIGLYLAEKNIDLIICIGNEAKAIFNGAIEYGANNVFYYKNQEEFFNNGLDLIKPDYNVLVKASRGMHFEKIIEQIQLKK